MIRIHALLLGTALLFPLCAPAQTPAAPPETPVLWPNLCTNTAKELLTVTTDDGDTIQGYCVFVQHDELAVRTLDGKMVRIARSKLKNVISVAVQENRLKALGVNMKHGLREGVKMTFSPLAPIGLATIPGTLAWGAVAAPFCIAGDLFGHKPRPRTLAIRQ